MSAYSGPEIPNDGLVMLLDAANPKSYNPAENLLRYSQTFTTLWTQSTATITGNTISAPDGTPTASTMTEDLTSNQHLIVQSLGTVAIGSVYTFSAYAKAGTRTQISLTANGEGYSAFNLSTGTVIQTGGNVCTITSVGNGWYRISATITRTQTDGAFYIIMWNNTNVYTGTGAYLYIWGAQINVGSYARPYTLTTTTAQTASTTWTDLTGTGNNVTLANAPTFTGTTFLLNGTSQWAYNNTPLLPTGKLNSTCLCWCRPDSTVTADTYVGLVSYGTRSSSDARLMSMWCNNVTAYTSSAYWNNDYVPQATAIALNAWNLVGMQAYGAPTTNNTTLLAGSSQTISYSTGNSSNYTAGLNTTSVNLAVGSTDYPGRYFKGQIAVVMFYNRALTTQEIDQNYDAYRGRFGI